MLHKVLGWQIVDNVQKAKILHKSEGLASIYNQVIGLVAYIGKGGEYLLTGKLNG